ncbi:hypothetical protein Sm713_32120 [Streptomyces sp. TS71-3]|nr:hypothetical protein Sm713_32120 [Streptomyces sp. TS71-3]
MTVTTWRLRGPEPAYAGPGPLPVARAVCLARGPIRGRPISRQAARGQPVSRSAARGRRVSRATRG